MSLPQSEDQLRQLAVDEVGMRLLRAAEVLRQRGWCQGSLSNGHAVCLIGAIKVAAGCDFDTWTNEAIAMEERVRGHLRVRFPYEWNDYPSRTADEVIAVLTAAAFRTGE